MKHRLAWICVVLLCWGMGGVGDVEAQGGAPASRKKGKKGKKGDARRRPSRRGGATAPTRTPPEERDRPGDPPGDGDEPDDNDDVDDADAAGRKAAPPVRSQAWITPAMRSRTKVFLYLMPIQAPSGAAGGPGALGTILTRLALSQLNRLEAVKLKTYRDMPSVAGVMNRYKQMEKMDRVSLIAIKNSTGFDGLIRTRYKTTPKGVVLTMVYMDFRNGKVFRKRTLKQALDASLFQTIQSDLVAFATAIRRSYRVTLRVQSQPPNAKVSIDGTLVGTAPLLKELRTGTHRITVSAEGHEPYEARLFLKGGDKLLLRAVLRKSRVAYEITSSPTGSDVYLGNKKLGVTPLQGKLPVGTHTLSVSRKGYKPFSKTVTLRSGDRLRLHVPLYNPLAARFLNAKPGFRLDTRQLHVGYRYVFLGIDYPNFRDVSFIDLSFLLRLYWFEVGLRLSPSLGVSSSNKLTTFLGEEQGLQSFDINLIQIHGVFKYALFEKYSFATVHLGASLGVTLSRVSSTRDEEQFRGSFSAEAFVSLVSRLARTRNFSFELQFDVGFAYLGQLLYKERTFSIFGQAQETETERPMFGPFGALTLRLVFWNGIF